VERFYSGGAYPLLQPILTSISNVVPVALFDVLCVAVLGAWVWLLIRDAAALGRRRWLRIVGRLVSRTLVMAAALYLAFLAAWGFNYRRVPLIEKVEFNPAAVSSESALRLAITSVNEVNARFRPAQGVNTERERVDPSLAAAFIKTQQALGRRVRHPVLARPKRSLLDPYFRAAAIDGMTAPFFMETLFASDILPVELPVVVAHEWSHLSGFADEGEANFVGWLTCLAGSEHAKYSGWLFLYAETAGVLSERDRAEVSERLEPGPRADLLAIAERRRRNVNPIVWAAGWRMYDQYLKANRVESGTASYGQVLRLVLGTRFGPDWTPVLKSDGPARGVRNARSSSGWPS
jgi:hypothetical protein